MDLCIREVTQISIHSPQVRRDGGCPPPAHHAHYFNPLSSSEERRIGGDRVARPQKHYFNPLSSSEERPDYLLHISIFIVISIHSPQVRRDAGETVK